MCSCRTLSCVNSSANIRVCSGVLGRQRTSYINDPKYWQELGEEAPSIAKLLDDEEAKRRMLAIAASYDRLSDHMKQRPRQLRK
jgi:hypothetical protein